MTPSTLVDPKRGARLLALATQEEQEIYKARCFDAVCAAAGKQIADGNYQLCDGLVADYWNQLEALYGKQIDTPSPLVAVPSVADARTKGKAKPTNEGG